MQSNYIDHTVTTMFATLNQPDSKLIPVVRSLMSAIPNSTEQTESDPLDKSTTVTISSDGVAVCSISSTNTNRYMRIKVHADCNQVYAILQRKDLLFRVNRLTIKASVKDMSATSDQQVFTQKVQDYFKTSGRPVMSNAFNTGREFTCTYSRHGFMYVTLSVILERGNTYVQVSISPADSGTMVAISQMTPEQIFNQVTDTQVLDGYDGARCIIPSIKTPPKTTLHPIASLVKAYIPHLNKLREIHGENTPQVMGELIAKIMEYIDEGMSDQAINYLVKEAVTRTPK